MAISPVVTGGFGSFGSIALIVRDGFGAGTAIIVTPVNAPDRIRTLALDHSRGRVLFNEDGRLRTLSHQE